MRVRRRLRVSGVVQGVGFRPFVYGLAARYQLAGFVTNDSAGVTIEIEGPADALDAFLSELRAHPPPSAHIEAVAAEDVAAIAGSAFEIHSSDAMGGASTSVSPDIATCDACLKELFDPADRRYRYPFLNCTDCGPRFTIIRDIPYDRPLTTMVAFAMCAECEREYHGPGNRRFHAQPNACPRCGPSLRYEPGGLRAEEALSAAQQAIREGRIVAIKGIGGFHLACDARNDAAIAELRRRKGRVDKPFALMARTVDEVRRFAEVNPEEAALLASRERPVVLLRRREASSPSPLVAPGTGHLGFLLPYSPLHHLLLEEGPLVMTSGNRSDEPIARDNAEALQRLCGLADSFLLHDREIHVVCDDSVVRAFEGSVLPVRRSRGYAPMPVRLPVAGPSVLAAGGELKSTFCLTREHHAYMSQHIGDMENLETLEAFERALRHMRAIFRVTPVAVACDAHPGYLSSRWAAQCGLPVIAVQHHHAHVASLMAEHGLSGEDRVTGVSFDGTGYGSDGAVWGGEFLAAGYGGFERIGHSKYVPLPGGDATVKRPYRMALAHLWAAGIEWTPDLAPVAACTASERRVLERQLQTGFLCVPTSSAGRLFDAAASLLGLRHTVTYEAQGALELEALADRGAGDGYEFGIIEGNPWQFDPAPLWREFLADLRRGVEPSLIAARFHKAIARLIVEGCQRIALPTVALTGGVFQNVLLLKWTKAALTAAGFQVLTHHVVPPNDAGLALGQAVVAMEKLRSQNADDSPAGPGLASSCPRPKPVPR